jgi:hypothetical protein
MVETEMVESASTANDICDEEPAKRVIYTHYNTKDCCISTPASQTEPNAFLPPGVDISFGREISPRKRRR